MSYNFQKTIEDSMERDFCFELNNQGNLIKEKSKQEELLFVEEFTKENPDWVKERRVSFLQDQIKNSLDEVFSRCFFVLTCPHEWLREFVCEEYINPLLKKAKKYSFEWGMWEDSGKLFSENTITDNDIEIAKEIPVENFVKIERNERLRSWALCPFHTERTPSFCVFKSSNKYYCFGCQKRGDVINLIMELHGLNFIEAVKYLRH